MILKFIVFLVNKNSLILLIGNKSYYFLKELLLKANPKLKMPKMKKSFIILIAIIFLGIFYRLYQANFDDYWLDEYFGFWVSDPQLNFTETLERSFGPGWGQNLLFDFVLKYFYIFFGYYPENGRYFTVFLSSLSIPLLTYLSYQVDKSKSYLLTAFLSSHCWYLISYSQEARSYSFGFFRLHFSQLVNS